MRVEGKRYRDEWLPNFYPSREIAADRWLRISRTGKTVVLSTAEDRQISEIFMDAPLYERLERTGHILTPANAARVFEEPLAVAILRGSRITYRRNDCQVQLGVYVLSYESSAGGVEPRRTRHELGNSQSRCRVCDELTKLPDLL
jgi:hypothetical protein